MLKKLLLSTCLILSLLCMSLTPNNKTISDVKPNIKKANINDYTENQVLNLTNINAKWCFAIDPIDEAIDTYVTAGELAIVTEDYFLEKTFEPGLLVESKKVSCKFSKDLASSASCDVNYLEQYEYRLCVFSQHMGFSDFYFPEIQSECNVFKFFGDVKAPTLNGTNNFVVNINKPMTQAEILSHVKVVDDTDGVITPTVVSTTYNPSNLKVGTYNMVLSAVDKAQNKAEITITIHVVDADAPVITTQGPLKYSYTNIPTITQVLNDIKATDNYDSNVKIKVVTDNYSNNAGKVGIYNIIVTATDSSGNVSAQKDIAIHIIDDIKPEIVVNGLNGSKEMVIGNNVLLTEEKLREKISVTDAYPNGNPTYTISGYDTYKNLYYKAGGRYQITINAKDSSNNMNQLMFTIVVTDKTAPSFGLDSYFVVLGKDITLTPEQIKDLAQRVLKINDTAIKDITITDTSNPNIKCAKVTLEDNQVVEINIEMGVKIDSIVMSWYHYIYKWFTILFNIDKFYKTGNFFQFEERCQSIKEVYTKGVFYER